MANPEATVVNQPWATMDRDLDALERALQAVKTRSANALLNEQSYLARIAQLEEVNRSLQAQLTVQGAAPVADASAADHHVSRLQDGVEGMKRSSSYMSMRTKSNHLVVAQLDDGRDGSDDGANIGDAERAGIERERELEDDSPTPTVASVASLTSPISSPSRVTFSRAPGLGVEALAAKLAAGATLAGPDVVARPNPASPPPPPRDRRCPRRRGGLFAAGRRGSGSRRSMETATSTKNNGGLGGFEGRDGGEDYGTPRTHSVESLSMHSPGTGRGGFLHNGGTANDGGTLANDSESSQSGSDGGLVPNRDVQLSRGSTPGLPSTSTGPTG